MCMYESIWPFSLTFQHWGFPLQCVIDETTSKLGAADDMVDMMRSTPLKRAMQG